MKLVYGDITEFHTDCIVNAANGIGFMGGFIGRFIHLPGVSESIHFKTKGEVERVSKCICKRSKWIPKWIKGYSAGEIFVTEAGNLKTKMDNTCCYDALSWFKEPPLYDRETIAKNN